MDQKTLADHSEPLVGLQNLIQYEANEQTGYWCSLCETSCTTVQLVISHVTSRLHLTNYMRQHYPNYLQVILNNANEKELLVLYAHIIERSEGRQMIDSRQGLDLSEFLQYTGQHPQPALFKTDVTVDTSKEQETNVREQLTDLRQPFEDTSITETLHKLATRLGYKSVGELMKNYTTSLVRNEEEATKALEAANFLTKAVLNYRLSSSPK